MRQLVGSFPSCDDATEAVGPARYARRQMLKAAVFGAPGTPHGGHPAPAPAHTVTGTILGVSPHVLVLQTISGEERLMLTAATSAWRGSALPPAALRQGDRAIVRRNDARGTVADRIWAEIGRVTGTIVERDGRTLLVDDGTGTGRKILVIGERAAARIEVRFPCLLPGYLIDVIGLRHDGFLEGLVPATAQPPYRADQPPAAPLVSGHVPDTISGTATWHEPGGEPDGLLGVAYPALDPETGCQLRHAGPARAPAVPGDPCATGLRMAGIHAVDPHLAGPGCVRLPYLSVGSVLEVRNECSGHARLLPVTGCGAVSRLFCDRCVTCGPSVRGRVADLTMAAFVELGGDLDAGCFNATITVGG